MTATTQYLCDRCDNECTARVEVTIQVFQATRKLHYCSDCWPVFCSDTPNDYEGRARHWLDGVEEAMRRVGK